MQKTAIIILNYNNYEDTINCIESVEKYNSAGIKYVVVDNGSPRDGVIESLHNYFYSKFEADYIRIEEESVIEKTLPKLTFLVSMTNDGYARGNNKGLRIVQKDETIGQILILNNDILFIEDILPEMLSKLQTLPNVGIVSPLLLKKDGKEIDYNCARTNVRNWEIILTYLCMYRNPFGWRTRLGNSHLILKRDPNLIQLSYLEIELPSGSCMLFEKELMERISLFDGGTFLYYEENIIFKQEQSLGLRNYIIPSLRCIHLGASSTKKSPSSFVIWQGVKSASYYLRAYGDMTLAQRIVLPTAQFAMWLKCRLISLVKDKKNR